MADVKLKPCPFCGGEAEVVKNEYFTDVSCKDDKCRGFADYLTFKKKSEAIEAWNRRATMAKEYIEREMTCGDCIHADVCEEAETLPEFNRENVAYCGMFMKAADVVEVVSGYREGDVCIYGFGHENKSRAIVEIVKILNDERGVAEVKFHKVFVDDTGNGFFNYLLKSGGTMNASFQYLKNITPRMDGDNNAAD